MELGYCTGHGGGQGEQGQTDYANNGVEILGIRCVLANDVFGM